MDSIKKHVNNKGINCNFLAMKDVNEKAINDDDIIKNSVIIDIPVDLEFSEWSKCSIFRVPRKLRKVNESAYTPQLVSIGPFHHNKPELLAMERLKAHFHAKLCARRRKDGTKIADPRQAIKAYIEKTSKEIRDSYAGLSKAELSDPIFEEIITVDASFIVELFIRHRNENESKQDYILTKPWLKKAVELDLILFENQIPLFVLDNVYDIVKPNLDYDSDSDSNSRHFMDLASTFLKDRVVTKCEHFEPLKTNEKDIKHFTDLLREYWLPREFIKNKTDSAELQIFAEEKYLYSATKLDRAGVKFERWSSQSSLTDVKLTKELFLNLIPRIQLRIPEMRIDTDTECLLRNVMALEQCVYPNKDYICSYVALMDQLINTSEDIDFLVDKKIISNLLGSDSAAAAMVNGLCHQIPRDTCCFTQYFDDLNKFYENRWNVTKATFKKVYFKDLLTGSTTIVAVFILLFTISATTKNAYLR